MLCFFLTYTVYKGMREVFCANYVRQLPNTKIFIANIFVTRNKLILETPEHINKNCIIS